LPLALRYQFTMLNRTPVTWAYPDDDLKPLLESFDTLTIALNDRPVPPVLRGRV
jgi:hypothetical protein